MQEPSQPDQPALQPALFESGETTLEARVAQGYIPTWDDIVLSAEQEAEARERWPEANPKRQLQYMKASILSALKHQCVIDPKSGRRAFGGAQPGSGRPRRLGNSLVEEAESRNRELLDAVFAPIGPGNEPEARHKAAINIYREVRKDREADMKEDELERASKEDIAVEAARILAEAVRNGTLDLDGIMSGTVDSDAVEVEAG